MYNVGDILFSGSYYYKVLAYLGDSRYDLQSYDIKKHVGKTVYANEFIIEGSWTVYKKAPKKRNLPEWF